MEYKVKKEELLEFAKKVYLEGCGGYMDLADSKSEIILDEFLKDKIPSVIPLYGVPPAPPPPMPTSFHERVSENVIVRENVLRPETNWSTVNNIVWTTTQHPWAVGADFANIRTPPEMPSNRTPDVIWPNDAINDGIAIRNDVELRNL